jgi:hypothetical protein
MRVLLLILAIAGLVGCGDKSDPAPPPQVQLNPGGAARTPQEQTMMDARRQAGEKSNQEMAEAAKEMAAAKAKAGK